MRWRQRPLVLMEGLGRKELPKKKKKRGKEAKPRCVHGRRESRCKDRGTRATA
jgi:hypothetical protein